MLVKIPRVRGIRGSLRLIGPSACDLQERAQNIGNPILISLSELARRGNVAVLDWTGTENLATLLVPVFTEEAVGARISQSGTGLGL